MALVPLSYYALLEVFIFLAVAELLHSFTSKVGLPNLVSDVLLGILLSGFALGGILNALFGAPIFVVNDYLLLFADFSVILLLFAAGLAGGFAGLRSAGLGALAAALAGDLVPFLAVFALFSQFYSLSVALLLGVAASGTSSAVVASLLQSEDLRGSDPGHFMMNVSALDDVVALLFLSVALTIVGGQAGVLAVTGGVLELVAAWIILLLAAVLILPRLLRIRRLRETRGMPFLFLFVIIVIVVSLGFSAIIGAYIAGIAIAESLVASRTRELTEVLLLLFGSLFFVVTGAQFDFHILFQPDVVVLALVLAGIAALGKFAGVYPLARRRFDTATARTVALGTVPLGEIGLIVGAIGITSGVLSQTQLGEILLMSLLTTLVASFLFRRGARRIRPAPSGSPVGALVSAADSGVGK